MVANFSREWHALGRESDLAAAQIGSGITALGRANHAQKGYYATAFFGLSIGLERLCKLIVIADYAISNSGRFPGNSDLMKCGHNIGELIDLCEGLSAKYRSGKEHADRPQTSIHNAIVTTLTEFARLSRYYNLDLIAGGKAARLPEPIAAWWRRVGVPILEQHYSGRLRERDAAWAAAMSAIMQPSSTVLHHSEEGDVIDQIDALMQRAAATRIVQRYGRLYTLQIIRWLAFLLSDLSSDGAYKHRIEPLLGLDERFAIFINEDKYLRDRKTWSIYL